MGAQGTHRSAAAEQSSAIERGSSMSSPSEQPAGAMQATGNAGPVPQPDAGAAQAGSGSDPSQNRDGAAPSEHARDAMHPANGGGTERTRSAAGDRPAGDGRDSSAAANPPPANAPDGAGREAQSGSPGERAQLAGQPNMGASQANTGAGVGAQSDANLFEATSLVARAMGDRKQALSIKLGAFAALAPSQVEPQRQVPPVGAVTTVASPGGSPPAELTDAQVPDAPLHKADVGPEHEAVVRRIFTRDE